MTKQCQFCDRQKLEPRVFYEFRSWFAFLAAPYNAKGHTIVAAKSQSEGCPTAINGEVLRGIDTALAEVAAALHEHYRPKDVLYASLRGDIKHVHFHAIPLWDDEECQWRIQTLYEKGHLFEFLGHLEKQADVRNTLERIERGWNVDEHRIEIASGLLPDVKSLRLVTRYGSA